LITQLLCSWFTSRHVSRVWQRYVCPRELLESVIDSSYPL
jgi:hypothetical protein